MDLYRTTAVSERSDLEFLDAVRCGEIAAYSEPWRRYAGFARAVARRVTSSLDAEDLASEAFIRNPAGARQRHGPPHQFRCLPAGDRFVRRREVGSAAVGRQRDTRR